ncbi:ATPase of 26S proteasome regulatory subunit 4 [Hypoxylon texense]
MHSLLRTTRTLLVLDLCTTVGALAGWPEGGMIVAGNAVRFDRQTWESNLAQPNATGTVQVSGFDISQRWPSEEVDGWTLSLNVSNDVPESQSMNADNTTTSTFTGTSIFLKAPENIQGAFTNHTALDEATWKICVNVVPNGPQEDQSEAGNGTCGFLSSQCVTDLQQAYADKFSGSQECYGTPPPTPSSCDGIVDTNNFQVQQLPLTSVNGTEVFVTASASHDAGDEAAWSNATRQVWPVLTVWGWNTRAQAPEDSSPRVQLSCIRANTVEPGSSDPPSSAEPTFRGAAILSLGIASVTAWYTSL